MSQTRVCIPVTPDGQVGGGFGRAPLVAIATVEDGAVTAWEVHAVSWDALHDTTTEGGHHARVARFLMGHSVQLVVVGHLGEGMRHMLDSMGLAVVMGATGDAREAVCQGPTGAWSSACG